MNEREPTLAGEDEKGDPGNVPATATVCNGPTRARGPSGCPGPVCASRLAGRPRAPFLAAAEQILHKASGRYNYDDDGIYARRRTHELY